jgi:NAD(P)-dependent dehydrogenase (short-subunit alcohol dehydrogenase family)
MGSVGREWAVSDLPDLRGRSIVVTGANSGIGLEATRNLHRAGATVVMACRNLSKAQVAADGVRRAGGAGELVVRELDLANLGSIRAFARSLTEEGRTIDVLMNNAGVMALDRGRTVDGFESQFGTNHLGHFALTGLLLPIIGGDDGGRVVTVTSIAHRPGRVRLDDPHFDNRRYSRWGAYFQSKLANVHFGLELDRRLRASGSRVRSILAHPGTARTELGKNGTSTTNVVMRRLTPVLVRTGVQGCEAQLRAAVDHAATGGDMYGPRWMAFGSPRLEVPARRGRDERTARLLWELSERATDIRYPFPSDQP